MRCRAVAISAAHRAALTCVANPGTFEPSKRPFILIPCRTRTFAYLHHAKHT